MKKIKCFDSILFWVLILFVCNGCAGGSMRNDSDTYYRTDQQLEISTQLRFEDLPVPSGFILNRKSSFIFENNNTRMGTLNYSGKADIGILIEFYKKNMVVNGWKLINSVEFGRVILNFENNKESCLLTIDKGMLVIIDIAPISRSGVVLEEEDNK
ncbi:MAG: hypothetical protein HY810_03090 [Candidatus Omnitrophica bacterium]|nr:hypothetical protein [Candidatus Omnitrophota bacterium]